VSEDKVDAQDAHALGTELYCDLHEAINAFIKKNKDKDGASWECLVRGISMLVAATMQQSTLTSKDRDASRRAVICEIINLSHEYSAQLEIANDYH
jgi:hypothetical protein